MRVLLFSPNAFITVHTLPEALVAEALQNNDIELIKVGCDGLYSDYCLSMSAAGIWPHDNRELKEQVCVKCRRNKLEINKHFNFKSIEISDYLDSSDINEINKIAASIGPDNWLDFVYDSIPVGRYAAYEFLLSYKLNSTALSTEQFIAYKIQLINSLKTLFAGKKIFEIYKPDRFLVYHGLYSVNRIMGALALQNEIPFYSLHAGSHLLHRMSEMTIFSGVKFQYLTGKHSAWHEYKKRNLNQVQIKRVEEHIQELIDASNVLVYSLGSGILNSENLKTFFEINETQKVILALMSSADENYAGTIVGALPPISGSIFTTQLEWIEQLISWAKLHPEVFIIIRVHPREFPNKRENVLSEQAKALKNHFLVLPKNVRVNWPEDDIPIHDLLKIIDLGLNNTSTAGLEILLHGIPVIIHDAQRLIAYPADLNICPQDRAEYFLSIERALQVGRSPSHIYNVYKWLSYRSEVVAIDISDGYRLEKPKLHKRIINRILRELNLERNSLDGLVAKRKTPLKNQNWLVHAIRNNQESHIQDYMEELEHNNAINDEESMKIMEESIKQVFNQIAINDQDFILKINKLFKKNNGN
jgi:hypothetical protein